MLQQTIPDAQLLTIASEFGHDGFLLEYEKIEAALKEFINNKKSSHLKIVNQ